MRRRPVPAPDAEAWASSLLSAETEALLDAARNYLGPVRTPYDKREIVSRLGAFLRRPETADSIADLLDPLDARVVGSSLLLGPATEAELRSLFAGEVPLFDIGIRVANLFDRLVLFRYSPGGQRLVAVNPLLAERLGREVLDPAFLFGLASAPAAPAAPELAESGTAAAPPASPEAGEREGPAPAPTDELSPALSAAAVLGILAHHPGSLRKGGGLTKRGAERVRSIAPALGARPLAALDALVAALESAGLVTLEGEDRAPDLAAFAALAAREGEGLALELAVAAAAPSGAGRGPLALAREAATLGAILAAAPRGLAFSRGGLARWIRVAARRIALLPAEGYLEAAEALAADAGPTLGALEALGLLLPAGEPSALTVHPALGGGDEGPGEEGAGRPAGGTPVLVAEGSHALHLLPEADLAARAFVARLARPVSLGRAWSFEIDRESARRAFAGGLGAAACASGLEALAGRALPQSLSFSLRAWEEEYRSLRLYRGLVLVADERMRLVVERSAALAPLVSERLAPGVYLLAGSSEEVAAALLSAGLGAPPETRAHRPGAEGEAVAVPPRERVSLLPPMPADWPAAGAGRAFDPERRKAELRAALAAAFPASGEAGGGIPAPRGPGSSAPPAGSSLAERHRELSERIERRIVVAESQIAAADVRSERNEAGGLDYLGKARIVERALRGPGDRLEVLYRLPGGEPVRALLRPVRLDKTDKGLVIEAEDLGTGGPVRVPLGAASSVRRLRASLFGEDA